MKIRKVLFCIDKLVRGGTELQLIGLIEHLDEVKIKPFLLTIKPTDPKLIPKDCVHLAWDVQKLFSINGIIAVFKLARFLKREKIDIVQTFFQDSTILGGIAGFIALTKIRIASFRDLGFWATPLQCVTLRCIYKLMTHCITNSNVVKQHFVKKFSVSEDKISVIPNGINVADFTYHKSPFETEIKVGIVGNMTRKVKRTDLFIGAAAKILQHIPRCQFFVIGDGELRKELEMQTSDLGISSNVIFTGRITDISLLLDKIDIGVLCSDSEGLSNAIIEYMLKGCCVVATNVGGNPELIDHEKTGILIPPGNVELLAEAIVKLAKNDELRNRLICNARAKAEKLFSWENCVELHSRIYLSNN